VTWRYTYSPVVFSREGGRLTKPMLGALVLRDGSLYFVALLLLNVTDMFTYRLNNTIGNLTGFILPISSMLISRFLFNIRQVVDTADASLQSETLSFVVSRTSTIAFASDAPSHAGSSSRSQADSILLLNTQGRHSPMSFTVHEEEWDKDGDGGQTTVIGTEIRPNSIDFTLQPDLERCPTEGGHSQLSAVRLSGNGLIA